MTSESNYLLEYAIDSLLKTFNPNRKSIMPRLNFFKLMDLLDTRLIGQGIDIELPAYWYKFGFYTELDFLDIVLPRSFTKFYTIDSKYMVPPTRFNRDYKISDSIKAKVDSTVFWLWKQYGFKPDYGIETKKESYKVNSPYKFNTTFQDYIEMVNVYQKESLELMLDSLLSEFPEKKFPEIYSTYLEWDDTTRLILDCVPAKKREKLIKELMELFWDTYSNGVKILHNKYIPIPGIIQRWKKEYELSIPVTYEKIEKIREDILLNHYNASGKDEETVLQLMKKVYEMSVEEH